MASERLLACHTLAAELSAIDLDTETEETLQSLLDTAVAHETGCVAELDAAPELPMMSATWLRQLRLRSLLIELALSRRFDGGTGLCAIVSDAFAELYQAIAELNAALEQTHAEDPLRAQLLELRDLDLEAIDVLLVTNRDLCPR